MSLVHLRAVEAADAARMPPIVVEGVPVALPVEHGGNDPPTDTITYSLGMSKFDATPRTLHAADFGAFRDAVADNRSPQKGLGWIAGEFDNAPDDAAHRALPSKQRAIGKPHRCKTCAMPRAWLGLDVDGGLDAEALAALVSVQQYSGLVYTTASSTATVPRCRGIIQLDMAAAPHDLALASVAFRARVDAAMVKQGYTTEVGFILRWCGTAALSAAGRRRDL